MPLSSTIPVTAYTLPAMRYKGVHPRRHMAAAAPDGDGVLIDDLVSPRRRRQHPPPPPPPPALRSSDSISPDHAAVTATANATMRVASLVQPGLLATALLALLQPGSVIAGVTSQDVPALHPIHTATGAHSSSSSSSLAASLVLGDHQHHHHHHQDHHHHHKHNHRQRHPQMQGPSTGATGTVQKGGTTRRSAVGPPYDSQGRGCCTGGFRDETQ
ncbi:unnamed protein product [Parajaminaea phylloscopi]